MKTKRRIPAEAHTVYDTCRSISQQHRKYLFGGGHIGLLKKIGQRNSLDCSSSVSLALWKAGIFPSPEAWVSGTIARKWGKPGKGKFFTVWAHDEHVWIQFHGLGRWWRFDTSPWNSGGYGPRVRLLPRPTKGFTARHWPGL